MKRIINILVAVTALVFLSSCAEREEQPHVVPYADKGIVVDFSSPDVKTRATVADTDYESHIRHLDILVFSSDGSLFWHERVSVSAAQGSHTLGVGTGYFAQKDAYGNVLSHPTYNIHILANCKYDMVFSESGRSLDVLSDGVSIGTYSTESTIGDIVLEEPNLHLSGLNISAAPSAFLMHSVAKMPLSDDDPEKNIVIKADLERAAAKVIINIKEGEHVEFTEGADLKTPGLFDKSERGLYYIRNMPYCTTLFPKVSVVADKSQLHTTPKTNSAHFTWNPASFRTDTTKVKDNDQASDVVTIVAYVYEHSWDDVGVFENEPVAIVNLPMIFVEEHDGQVGYHAHADSWYKIPLSKDKEFVRNNCYVVNVKINYAGATTVMEPVIVPDIEYEVLGYDDADGNMGWKTHTVSINQEARPKYLTISTTQTDMVNETVNDIVRFSSSSEVTASIASCYYYDEFGNQVNVSPGGDIKVSASPGVMGTIKVEAPVPTNNTPRYVYVKVSNGESEDRYFTVVQYPLEYITNVQGYYSYRDDFGGTTYEAYQRNRYVSAEWNSWNGTWSYSTGTGKFFTSKVAKVKTSGVDKGKSTIHYYKYGNNGKRTDESAISGLDNGRMYRVKLASSSADYSVGIPRLDEKGWTDDSQENKLLVSPSFMIASQLGATLAPTSVQQAASHCSQYVETYKDESGRVIHLNDWRLPTEAEINIIIRFQYRENAAMDEVLSGHWYWSATGQVENPGAKDQSSTTSAVRCVRSDF